MVARDIKDRMLSAMRPAHGSEPPARWQQRKSAQTRLRLIEAAVDCLVGHGYPGLTTAAVAERCLVSRGAMHHHFATRRELVSAVIEHVFYRRMAAFLEDYFAALPDWSGGTVVDLASVMHWKSVQTREYAAYLELAVAARTDAELDALFAPAAERYDAIWSAEMIEAFPQWSAQWDAMKLANDFTLAVHMGMLLHQPVFGAERIERLRLLAARVIRSLHDADKTGTTA